MFSFEYTERNARFPVAYSDFEAMHTRAEILIVGQTQERAYELVSRIFETVTWLERKLNRFDVRSELSLFNSSAGEIVRVEDGELFKILGWCEKFHKATCGYFDVCAAEVPAKGEFLLETDIKANAIRKRTEQVGVDLGGFAKGYVLELIKNMLRDANADRALVNLGNSSVLAVGAHPYGDSWPVAVEDPTRQGEALVEFKLADESLSVSGVHEGGEEHIVDPIEGRLREKGGLLAVQGLSPLLCEVLSTALYAAPKEKWGDILDNFEGYRVTEIELPGQAKK